MRPEELAEIFAKTLTGDYDEDGPWEAVRKLHHIGSREVFDRAAAWCISENALKRARGADILAQLGLGPDSKVKQFPEECFSVVSTMLEREKDPLGVLSAIYALGHMANALAIPLVLEHRLHPDPDVRHAVAFALGTFADDPRTVDPLLALMQDSDDDVRDWATFALGVLGDANSDEVRDSLWQRMSDSNRNVREEALVALARRDDQRALPALIAELNQPEISDRVIDAAEEFLGEKEVGRTPSEYIDAIRKRFSF